MKSMLFIATVFVAISVYQVAGQALYCYSCSSNFGSSYGSVNPSCLGNLTNLRAQRCYAPSYCLTTYVVTNGVVSSLRRSCENPRYDYDSDTTSVPTENKCVSSHSSYNSRSTTTCYLHCTSPRCNNQTPSSIKTCSSSCADSCDILTGKCQASMSCVQCSSETDKGCEQKTTATPCPGGSYNHCAATKSYVLNADQQVVLTTFTKTCTTLRYSYDFPRQPCVFEGRGSNNEFTKYSCSSFCSTNGCNDKYEDPAAYAGTSGLRCYVCSQTGSSGSCRTPSLSKLCPPSATHCKSTVIYYTTSIQDSSGRPIHRVASIKRECSTEAVEKQCTTTNVAGPNLQHVTCQETCQGDNCNNGWPARPKCFQCNVYNSSWNQNEFQLCRTNPTRARPCSSPLFTSCYSQSNNTAGLTGVSRIVARGCSIRTRETRCYDITRNGRTSNNCQTACSTDSCNNDELD